MYCATKMFTVHRTAKFSDVKTCRILVFVVFGNFYRGLFVLQYSMIVLLPLCYAQQQNASRVRPSV